MSGWPRRGGWREEADSCSGDRPRGQRGRRRHFGRVREGGRPPACLSHSTVKHHLASARSKVGATTRAQLVWILAPRLPQADATVDAED